MRYAIVIEGEVGNYSAYVPDLPGCVTAGETLDDVTHDMFEAIQLHLDGMKEDGLPIPEPTTQVEYVEI
ncbi:MAG: type II toxin-antitoxin system HicB family antitoxin [Chloroflexi bacterium]|nr:type II toxin-antitoxin system HicB family antitoxin [Chloroflexota bacterium]MCC6896616.1 type II toxin-antitoxin system HicB family antitoxin [Anaerolineae bacterium]